MRDDYASFCNTVQTNITFCASAPTLWNSLPRSIRFCESWTFRKHRVKTFYFQSAFPSDPLPQGLRFSFWHWRFINSFTYLLTYLIWWKSTAHLFILKEQNWHKSCLSKTMGQVITDSWQPSSRPQFANSHSLWFTPSKTSGRTMGQIIFDNCS